MKIPEENGGNFEPTPEGQHPAVCTRFIDLGTQTVKTQYGVKDQRKVVIGWEIPEQRKKYTYEGKDFDKPFLHTERYTWSMHEKATLRQRLEAWRGKKFTQDDFGVFNVRNLIGKGAMMQIIHDPKEGGGVYANISSIMYLKDAPRSEEVPISFTLDPDEQDDDERDAMFNRLSENMQKMIMESPEWKALKGEGPPMDDGPGSENPGDGLDDGSDIPF